MAGSSILTGVTILGATLIMQLSQVNLSPKGSVSASQLSALPDSTQIDQVKLLALYMEEWKTVIQTQMHFNDLIIRFRSFVLAAIGALFGALLAWDSKWGGNKDRKWFWTLSVTLLAMWISAFVMDYCYYFKMLLGAVESAKKFDVLGREFNPQLFGLTETINNKVSVTGSSWSIIIYYCLPVLSVIILRSLPGKWFKSKNPPPSSNSSS
jgi:hypothetical protein